MNKETPKITLKPLPKTAVHTPTEEEFRTLMQVYKLGKWRGYFAKYVSDPSTDNYDLWNNYKENTATEAGINIFSGEKSVFGIDDKRFYKKNRWNVISTQEFYKKQKITQKTLDEVHSYFLKD